MTRKTTVLISGGGIAGSTLAYWLARRGFAPTVVEQAGGVRSSGNPVDVRGRAVDIASEMGIMSRLTEAATHVRALRLVDAGGRRVATMNLTPARRASGAREVEVPRSRLAAILLDAARDDAEQRFGDSIRTLDQDVRGVDVTFASGREERFDLVVGADGLHSAVRRLVFAPDAETVRYLGLFVATLPLDGPPEDPRDVVMYNAPGRSASLHPGAGQPIAAFIFRSPERPDFDHRDTAQHRRILAGTYAGGGWRVPELLERAMATPDLYFDAVSQVHLPRWSSGRVVLLGDAASCVSLFGEGSSLAIIGARTLADEMAASTDPALAFRRYETAHRARVLPKQRGVRTSASLLVPKTRAGIALRNLLLRTVATVTRPR